MSRCAPTPLRPMPRVSLVALAASTPPNSSPLWPMWPIASIEGAPCCPLHCWISEVKESWPSESKVPRVPACVAFSTIEYGGLTLAIGEFSSQVCDRSKMRARSTVRMKSSLSSPCACAPVPASARPAAAAVLMNSRRLLMALSFSPRGKFAAVERLARRSALHVVDAALLRVLGREHDPGRRAVGHRVERHAAQVLVGVGVVLPDRVAHLVEVFLEHRFLRLVDARVVARHRERQQGRDDGEDH